MKKLIIAAAIALAGVAAQASKVNWGLNTATLDATKFASGTAYLICVDDLTRPTLATTGDAAYDWYKANIGTVKSSAFRTATVSDGAVYETEDIAQAIGMKKYWLLIDNNETADADHFFAVSTTTKQINITTGSLSQTAAWNGGTQMGVFNVPEPTSGLMLLLGVAGLALRRRRA